MNKSVGKVLLFALFTALTAGTVLFLRSKGWDLRLLLDMRDRMLDYIADHTLLSVLMYVAAYIAVTALSIPGATVLTLLGGFFFGPFLGVLLVNIGATAGAFLIFLLARHLLRDSLQGKYGESLAKLNRELGAHGASYLLTLRFIPLFPFFLINLLAGLTPVSSFTYLWTTSVGIIPGSLIYTLLGSSGAELGSADTGLPPSLIAGFVLLGIVSLAPVLVRKYKSAKAKRSPS
jgi:uncharacterized membrane protein YdjX (TVP38/TMEM64 family)